MHLLGSYTPGPAMLEFPKQQRLRRRLEFSQTMDAGIKVVMPHMVLLVRRSESALARVGFIVSKKVGGSVERNSVKRRLREVYRIHPARPTHIDLVVIARQPALQASFAALESSFSEGLKRVMIALERRERPRGIGASAGASPSSGLQIPSGLIRTNKSGQSSPAAAPDPQ